MKKVFVILGWIVGGICVLGIVGGLVGSIGMGDIKKLTIVNVDISQLPDGIYSGSYHKARWTYDAKVTIKDHRIVEIVNTNAKMNTMGDFNQKIAAAIIAQQSPNIDVVGGATVNTRAFAKAVELALVEKK